MKCIKSHAFAAQKKTVTLVLITNFLISIITEVL